MYDRMLAKVVGRPSMDATCLRIDTPGELADVMRFIRKPKFYKYFPFNNSDPKLLPRITARIRDAGFDDDVDDPAQELEFPGTDALKFPVAVKLIYHDVTCDPIWMEAAVYYHMRSRFNSRYVPKYYGTTVLRFDHPTKGRTHHYRGITLMEFLEDFEPTGHRIERGPLNSWESAMLEEAHFELWGAGVMHADLHPHNIMVKTDPETDHVIDVRVIDFNRSIFLPARAPKANSTRKLDEGWVYTYVPRAACRYTKDPATVCAIMKKKPDVLFDFDEYAALTGRRLDDVTIGWYRAKAAATIPKWFDELRDQVRSVREELLAHTTEDTVNAWQMRSEPEMRHLMHSVPCEWTRMHRTILHGNREVRALLDRKRAVEETLWRKVTKDVGGP